MTGATTVRENCAGCSFSSPVSVYLVPCVSGSPTKSQEEYAALFKKVLPTQLELCVWLATALDFDGCWTTEGLIAWKTKFTQKNKNMLLALRAHCSELGMPNCELKIHTDSWDLCWRYNNALILSTLLWQFCWLKRDKVQWCATVVPWGAPSEEDYYTSIEYEKGETPGWQANMVDLPAVDAPALGVRFSQRFSVVMNWKVALSVDKPLSRHRRHRGGTQAPQCPEDELIMCEECGCIEVEQDGEDRCNMCLRAAGMDVS